MQKWTGYNNYVATAREVDLIIEAAQDVVRYAFREQHEQMAAAERRLDKLVDKIKSRAEETE